MFQLVSAFFFFFFLWLWLLAIHVDGSDFCDLSCFFFFFLPGIIRSNQHRPLSSFLCRINCFNVHHGVEHHHNYVSGCLGNMHSHNSTGMAEHLVPGMFQSSRCIIRAFLILHLVSVLKPFSYMMVHIFHVKTKTCVLYACCLRAD